MAQWKNDNMLLNESRRFREKEQVTKREFSGGARGRVFTHIGGTDRQLTDLLKKYGIDTSPCYYTAGTYGWNCDIYYLGTYRDKACWFTWGNRPFGKEIEYSELEDILKEITHENLRESEEHYITSEFACGPGYVYSYWEDDDEEDFSCFYYKDIAENLENFIKTKFAKNQNDNDLVHAYQGEGVKSIKFKCVREINHKYYLIWDVKYNPEIDGIQDDIISFLEGEMSDGWGEDLSQFQFDRRHNYMEGFTYTCRFYPWYADGEFNVEVLD